MERGLGNLISTLPGEPLLQDGNRSVRERLRVKKREQELAPRWFSALVSTAPVMDLHPEATVSSKFHLFSLFYN